MCREYPGHTHHARTHRIPLRRQRGFSLPVAILAIVLLSLLGAAMVSILSTGHRASAYVAVSSRAFYAAESGVQYGLGKVFPLDGSPASCTAQSLSFTPPGLAGCTATVSCSGPVTINGHDFYTLTGTGKCASGEDQAVRTIQVGARTP